MKEDMLEVLIYLFENYIMYGNTFESEQEDLAEELVGAGFPSEEVEKAFIWLEGLLNVSEVESRVTYSTHTTSSLRFYTPAETRRLTTQGISLLIRLANAGVLDFWLQETVIERVMALDSHDITIDHIKWVVLMVLSNQPSFDEIADWAEVIVSDDLIRLVH